MEASARELVPRMFKAMYEAPGIGLAAPQVGVDLRVVVVDLMPDNVAQPMTMINPQIVAVSDEWATREEGCLSDSEPICRCLASGTGDGSVP